MLPASLVAVKPINHSRQLEKCDSKLQAVDVLDIARMFVGEITMPPDHRAPDDGEPKHKVLTVETTANVASLTGSCEELNLFDEVTNANCPRVTRDGQVSMQVHWSSCCGQKTRGVQSAAYAEGVPKLHIGL
jgi:hypothetical protein